MLIKLTTQVDHFFRGAIHHQDSIHTGLPGVACKFRMAIPFNRVEVTHQHNRRIRIALPKTADHFQYPCQADALGDSTFAGSLDHRAIGRRVGKRYTQFQQIGACLSQCVHDVHRPVRIRITCRNEGNQSRSISSSGSIRLPCSCNSSR